MLLWLCDRLRGVLLVLQIPRANQSIRLAWHENLVKDFPSLQPTKGSCGHKVRLTTNTFITTC